MTVKEWLESLAGSNTSTDQDCSMMTNLLRKIGFPSALATCGVVYPLGSGQPVSIQQMAKLILETTR